MPIVDELQGHREVRIRMNRALFAQCESDAEIYSLAMMLATVACVCWFRENSERFDPDEFLAYIKSQIDEVEPTK